ncbi:MAG: bifunctional DNA-formamidopyrimidine glycosylase/DNA-(apurinic or apyrimidinic site) lyase [Phycisphaerales bacterium]
MPELPEVECLRRTLEPTLVGARVEAVRVRRRSFLEAAGFERAIDSKSARLAPLADATIDRIERHGKELAIVPRGSGHVLRVRLGMTGGLRLEPETRRPEPLPHEHARWILATPRGRFLLRHADARRFGDLTVFPDRSALDRDRRLRLGPDALESPPAELAAHLEARLEKTSRAVKVALLDQSVLAGLGNIYADESLFQAGLSPSRPARALTRAELAELAKAISGILEVAIAEGGSTLRDYRDAQGRQGTAQERHQVYGRVGSPCLRCGGSVSGISLGGRTTAFCGHCQQ